MGWKTETKIKQFIICDNCGKEEESSFRLKSDASSCFKNNGWVQNKEWKLYKGKKLVMTLCTNCVKNDGEK